jgi:capsid protein
MSRTGKLQNQVRMLEQKLAALTTPPSLEAKNLSGYDGANQSIRRGRIHWQTLETRKELDSFSRDELLRRCRWLRANVGLVKGLVKNGSMLVGWMTPQARTADQEWNDLADKNFKMRAMTKGVFDAGGKFNFKTAQRMIMQRALCDGDILTLFTETPSAGARVAFYEAHQLRNPSRSSQDWFDGILSDDQGRHLVYGLSNGKDVKTFSARDACYFGWFESPGHNRAHPPLSHAVNHAVDITEVWADTKHGIKNSARLGIVSEFETGARNTRQVNGMTAALPGGTPSSQDAGNGKKVRTEEIWGGGQMQYGEPGEKFKILSDSRPHPNQGLFIDELVRDISMGYGLPPEVIHKMAKLTGPGVRFVMEFAGRWIEDWQLELIDWCQRYWVYHMSKEIKAGRLPVPKDDMWMLGVEWTPRRSLTIDRGKDGKQRLDEIDAGAGTLADWYADVDGADWKMKVRQRIAEVKFAMDECSLNGMAYTDVFRVRQGAAGPPKAESPKPDPEEQEEEEDDEE